MAKLNPLAMSLRPRLQETRTFTDSAQPGAELTLTLCEQDVLIQAMAQATSEELTEIWGAKDDGSQRTFPMGGKAIVLPPMLLNGVSVIFASQSGAEEDRYSTDELIALSLAMSAAWDEVCEWAVDLTKRGKKRGNASGAGEASSSVPPSPSTSSTPVPSSGTPKPNGSDTSNSGRLPELSALTT